MDLSIVFLIAIIAAFVGAFRRLAPDRPTLLYQGLFRYQADLGWPRGVQEDDGERAWVPHTTPAPEPEAEEDELAWAALIVMSTMSDRDGDAPPVPVPVVRVRRDTLSVPRRVQTRI